VLRGFGFVMNVVEMVEMVKMVEMVGYCEGDDVHH